MRLRLWASLLCLAMNAAETVKEADPKNLAAIVSFLSSDALEGRDTPSPGLTIASEYIASEFRRNGLKPAVNGSYFQVANIMVRQVRREGFELRFEEGEKTVRVPLEGAMWNPGPKVDLAGAALRKLKLEELKDWNPEAVEPVILLEASQPGGLQQALAKLGKAGAKLVVLSGLPIPLPNQAIEFDDLPKLGVVLLRTADKEAEAYFKGLSAGVPSVKVSGIVPEATAKTEPVRNVIGILPGSDAVLKDEYVLLTAHYDHLGIRVDDSGDKIYNGANDDASGVASVIEAARLLAALPQAPKRSVMFAAFFGEEKGLQGSRYMMRHPIVPLKQLAADLNLEQTGRTDSKEGANIGQANLTGYDFTTIHDYVEAAGIETGLKLVKHEQFSDPFFQASDNASFAPMGVPSTTLSVTYEFPDYHGKGDEWEKIDYANMAKVTRTAAQSVQLMANAPERVKWNERETKTKAYREAAKKLLGN